MITSVNLYRKSKDDGNVRLLTVTSDGFSCQDDFQEAIDFHLDNGFFESYKEACNS